MWLSKVKSKISKIPNIPNSQQVQNGNPYSNVEMKNLNTSNE